MASETLVGGYRLVKHMPAGQISQVWEAVEVASGRHFAIKMLLPEHAVKSEARKVLFHEAEVPKELNHPNVIKVFHICRDSATPYFVMEFFPAGSLMRRIMPKPQWDFLKQKADGIMKQWATALAYLNASGWVHRDVKPDNILVNSAGEVRLIDFALAVRIPSGLGRLFRRRTKAMGTRSYMSPEQIRGEALDGRADVYSWGASAYETVTGRPPFRGSSSQELLVKQIKEKPITPAAYNPDVTQEFGDLVLRCLAKRRDDRPHDFHEVLMALRNVRVFKGSPEESEVD